jgi:hypothetical protein
MHKGNLKKYNKILKNLIKNAKIVRLSADVLAILLRDDVKY